MTAVFNKCMSYVKKEIVFCISFLLALASAFFVPPSSKYLGYINLETLAILFVMMVLVQFLSALGIFNKIALSLLSKVNTSRQIITVLVMLCFFLSMFITNDVALLTFVPFAFTVLEYAKRTELIIPTVVLQTIAANLGSMILPIGNPQNIFIYSISGISLKSFVATLLPYYLCSFVLLVVSIALIPNKPVTVPEKVASTKHDKILKRTFFGIDWFLLLTFVCFFVFIGNVQNIELIRNFMERVTSSNEILLGIVTSQVISNVPAAIMLGGFTKNYTDLLVGVNLGGLGTLIASMASLISYKFYANRYNETKGKFVLWFTVANIVYILILVALAFILAQ